MTILSAALSLDQMMMMSMMMNKHHWEGTSMTASALDGALPVNVGKTRNSFVQMVQSGLSGSSLEFTAESEPIALCIS